MAESEGGKMSEQLTMDNIHSNGRWTQGGNGSHWDGCEDVHWDCKIVALTARIAELEAENRWIPVSERLPEHKQPVLAAADGEVTNTYYDVNSRKWSQSEYFWFPDDTVTHWRSLPLSPSEEE